MFCCCDVVLILFFSDRSKQKLGLCDVENVNQNEIVDRTGLIKIIDSKIEIVVTRYTDFK